MRDPDTTISARKPRQDPVRGQAAAIREAAAGMFKLVPDLAFDLVSVRFGEDFWVVQWKLSSTSAAGARSTSTSRTSSWSRTGR
ncbi:hypothetical protein ACFWMG_18035 [Streptomyces sp. NPDC127074]|uniref:hypothetical protein n=1 Tax=Streptomyces sp. NPDC127074 TaxID=3347130 RepID=UPI00365B3536